MAGYGARMGAGFFMALPGTPNPPYEIFIRYILSN
jgi:hypothetical protein